MASRPLYPNNLKNWLFGLAKGCFLSRWGTRVLIVKLAAIGDVAMALAMLPAIRKKHSSVHISWLCGAQAAPIVRATGLVDEVLEVDEKRLLTGSFAAKALHLLKVWTRLGFRQFDYIYTLHRDPRYRLLTMFSFCKHRKCWKRDSFPRPGRYHAEENICMLDVQPIDIQFPVLSAKLRDDLLYLFERQPLVAIAPGGAKNVLADDCLRRWPIESYSRLIRLLNDKGISVVVTGSEGDRWVTSYLPQTGIYNCIGQLDLMDLLAVLKNCSLLITHDSGPLHLAKLVQCPTVALFGPTDPFERTSCREKIHVIWGGKNLSCRPCYNGKTYRPCKSNICLSEVSSDDVFQMAISMIQGNTP